MAETAFTAGRAALAVGDWVAARDAFEKALRRAPSADALDGLGQALWWLKDPAAAIELRTRAYAALQRAGRARDAALTAVWLGREHRSLYRNAAVSQGWISRATSIAATAEVGSAQGWIALAQAEAARDVAEAIMLAQRAVDIAVEHHDPDLEIVGLARCGALKVSGGHVEAGVRDINEAMAAATAGEGTQPQNIGEAFCALMEAAALLGDMDRFSQWAGSVVAFRESYDFGPLAAYGGPGTAGVLSSYCGACCGGVFLVNGRLDEAEQELTASIAALTEAGLHSRCVHPVTQLAELRLVQGRFEEAAMLLADYSDFAECVRPQAVLDLASGQAGAAVERLRRGIDALHGQTVRVFGLVSLSVDAFLAAGDIDAASDALAQLQHIAAVTGSRIHAAETLFARGKIAAARRDPEAGAVLRQAARACSDAAMVLSACRARLALARTLADSERGVAITEARAALAAFDRLGATLDAATAASFLRELGVKGRTGPKNAGVLSAREKEVLRLVSEGLSNAEIATRLFISVKTAGHHVSSILSKLGLRSRTEAAAYAVLHLPRPAQQ